MKRTIFITGASSGIGAALAAHYAAEGATLGLTARRGELLAALAASLPTTAVTYVLDVTDAEALRHAALDFVSRHGAPDIVIANAGISIGTSGSRADDLAVLAKVLATNVTGAAATLQPFIAPMRTARCGTLVGIASVAGIRGLPGSGAYSASKAALISWLESLRVELHGSGVRVKTILPGYIQTPMTAMNDFPMPFLLPVDEAARRIARAIDGPANYAVIPWQMGAAAMLLRLLPDWAYDRLFAHAPRKPRARP